MTFIVTVRELVPGGGWDDFGNPIEQWQERPWEVQAIAPGAIEEGVDRGTRDLTQLTWTILADKGEEPGENAQVRLPGSTEWYEVEGRPKDWTMGPPRVGPSSGFPLGEPGVVVELWRSNG